MSRVAEGGLADGVLAYKNQAKIPRAPLKKPGVES
jgi:hypothetical protein